MIFDVDLADGIILKRIPNQHAFVYAIAQAFKVIAIAEVRNHDAVDQNLTNGIVKEIARGNSGLHKGALLLTAQHDE